MPTEVSYADAIFKHFKVAKTDAEAAPLSVNSDTAHRNRMSLLLVARLWKSNRFSYKSINHIIQFVSLSAACKKINTKIEGGWSWSQSTNPEVVTSTLEPTKPNPEPPVCLFTKPEAWQSFLCFITNANVITVTLTAGRVIHQHLWNKQMNGAIHLYTGLMDSIRLHYWAQYKRPLCHINGSI